MRFENTVFNILLSILFISSVIRVFNSSILARAILNTLSLRWSHKCKFKGDKFRLCGGHKSVGINRSAKNGLRNCMVSCAVCRCPFPCWNQTLLSLRLRRVMKLMMISLYVSTVIIEADNLPRHGTPYTHFQGMKVSFPVYVRVCG